MPALEIVVRPDSVRGRAHLSMLRLASKAGHIRTSAAVLRELFRGSGGADVTIGDGGAIRVRMSDVYWSRVLVGWEHEPEVRSAIEVAVRLQPAAVLIDAGANIGYWGAVFARRMPVIAVEAVPPTFELLTETAKRNGFIALNNAIWSESGDLVSVRWSEPADPGASVVDGARINSSLVRTISLDDVWDTHAESRPAVVKLDVEGAEIAAIKGAAAILKQTLWLYEDHGSDVSQRFWDAGLTTGHMRAGQLTGFRDLPGLDEVKRAAARDPGALPRGVRPYNFVALDPEGPFKAML